MYKMFEIILDDGENVYKHRGIYADETEAANAATGNGEIVRIRDVTSDFPLSQNKVYEALIKADFGNIEANAIASFMAGNYSNGVL